jgi:hypothetical protein
MEVNCSDQLFTVVTVANRGKRRRRRPTLEFEGESEKLSGGQLELVTRAGGCSVSARGRAVEARVAGSKQEVAASVSKKEIERGRI